ncbi:MAG: hypothetical protein ACYCO9_12815 [Streptosporangiaceae bacterium]
MSATTFDDVGIDVHSLPPSPAGTVLADGEDEVPGLGAGEVADARGGEGDADAAGGEVMAPDGDGCGPFAAGVLVPHAASVAATAAITIQAAVRGCVRDHSGTAFILASLR